MTAADFLRRAKLSRGYRKLTERTDGPLTTARATARLSAYVYGNILALGAVVIATPESIADGDAALVVAATGATTFVAHVFSDFVAHGGLGSDDDTDAAGEREHALAELRDATPIATSATFPTLALVLGWLGLLPTAWAFTLAGGIVVFRIATVQMVAKRIRGVPLTPRVLLAGLLAAAFAAAIVALKVALTH
ncbi:hypothetical protein HH308_02270 [Gordonia sp. TBRC 11910]|uniref:Uncharacterized protein n=1 Tax=Gordonia asplenii TaxID=2725283 RepID=A0A848KMY6_9ACTN|nr:hypothetical protein [Gordonia asplenii]NMO00036.1 hypothetical protein [Gordonia asplenii]